LCKALGKTPGKPLQKSRSFQLPSLRAKGCTRVREPQRVVHAVDVPVHRLRSASQTPYDRSWPVHLLPSPLISSGREAIR
jgi:hypothetical protein